MKEKRRLIDHAVLSRHGMELILAVTFLIMAIFVPGFFTGGNLLNIMRTIALQGVIAFGMTFAIISGEMDLSISSSVALTGVIVALVSEKLASAGIMAIEYGAILGIVIALIVACLIGLFNGFILTKFHVPSFIITLAMMNIIYGIAAMMSGGFPVTTLPRWFNVLGAGTLGPIPIPAIILVVVFIITHIALSGTKFGREVYAVGGNAEAARLTGINVKKVKILSLIIVQLMAALSGLMLSSQVMSGASSFGKGWEMNVISSVIIGGASLQGGSGRAIGTFIGIAFLGIIINSMTLLNINEFMQYVVRGALILIAVLINTLQTRKKAD